MQVFKIEKPILALALLAVADGNNFDELSAEVSEIGGSAELISDELARVIVKGRTYDLPIGYVLVFDGGYNRANGSEHIGYGRLLSKVQFDAEYISVGASGQVDDLMARVAKLESEVGKLTRANNEPVKAKSGAKAKVDKTSEPAAGA